MDRPAPPTPQTPHPPMTGPLWTPRTLRLEPSPWEGHASVDVFVREAGTGVPLVFLHGGWGYGAYSFDAVARELVPLGFRCIAPDRTGYGQSTPIDHQPLDFHARAAHETTLLLDALGIGQALVWGHSDGAVIALWMAIREPARFPRLVLESVHAWSSKPRSRAFFESAARGTVDLPERTTGALRADHGDRWPTIVRMNGRAWVDLAAHARGPQDDLYGGRLRNVRSRTLLLHGTQDPRTESGEIEWVHNELRASEILAVPARHAPHVDANAWAQARGKVRRFLDTAAIRPQPG